MMHAIEFFLETNVSLMALLLVYKLSVERENAFTFMRFFLVGGIIVSLSVPFLDLTASAKQANLPVFNNIILSNWLPEIVISENVEKTSTADSWSAWQMVKWTYFAGLAVSAAVFLYRLIMMMNSVFRSKKYTINGTYVSESCDREGAFSFFNVIFIGNADSLSEREKVHIVKHEAVHAQKLHSLDILLVSIVEVIFWFNPVIRLFRKYLVQIHEFEADARAVESQDVDGYCNLMARVALQAAGFKLGNHFNNSLTIKRIQMMRKLKTKIRWWKIAGPSMAILAVTIFFACTEQITTSMHNTPDLPVEAKRNFEAFKATYPGETFIVEYDEQSDEKLAKLDAQYGNPKHQELFTITDNGTQRTFAMLVFKMTAVTAQTPVSPSQDVFEVVEVMPEFNGGFSAMVEHLSSNLLYPKQAREQGIEGTCFVTFIVEKDGSLSNIEVKQGFDEACDAESVKVISAMPAWRPGATNGQVVRTRMVMPIKFKL